MVNDHVMTNLVLLGNFLAIINFETWQNSECFGN